MAHIYKTTNMINGKIYIGKEKHNDKNYLGSGRILNNAIRKYGKENFTKEILEECSLDVIDERECYWIERCDSTNWDIGYNITKGGTGGDTTSHHPDKEALIQKRKDGLRDWHQRMSIEEKQAWIQGIRESRTGNFRTGRKHKPETIAKIKESNKLAAQNRSEETIKNHQDAMAKRRGKPFPGKYKKVLINGIEYESIKHACEAFGYNSSNSIYQRVKRGTMTMEYL